LQPVILKSSFDDTWLILQGLFLVFFYDTFTCDDEIIWKLLTWDMTQPQLLFVFFLVWFIEYLTVDFSSNLKTYSKYLLVIDLWFILSLSVTLFYVVLLLYVGILDSVYFMFLELRGYLLTFFWHTLFFQFLAFSIFSISKHCTFREILLMTTLLAINYAQNLVPDASAGGNSKVLEVSLQHTRHVRNAPLFLDFSETVGPGVRKHRLSIQHPMSLITCSEFLPFKDENTLMMSWTHHLNYQDRNLRKLLKKTSAFIGPFLELPPYKDFYIGEGIDYDPYLAVDRYYDPNYKELNPGMVFKPHSDVVLSEEFSDEATLTPSQFFFYHHNYRLWDTTERFFELSSLILEDPNSFNHLCSSQAVYQELLSVDDFAFDNYISQVQKNSLGLEEFKGVLPSHVFNKPNFS
jgi:hypothetical protein